MERYKPYEGRRNHVRRRRSGEGRSANYHPEGISKRGMKLVVCGGLFALAALIKLLFPGAFMLVGEKINEVVNYKAALTALGEGFSGEKKFTAALGEAFTYAFTGDASQNNADVSASPNNSDKQQQTTNGTSPEKTADSEEKKGAQDTTEDKSVSAFSEASPKDGAISFSDAVIAAFKESQEEYSDYSVPAGVTYDMPSITFAHTAPLVGTVSSPFGYRMHPIKNTILFHYGIDVAAPKGTAVNAFADGKVIAVGESTSLGKYVLVSHGSIESEYAHCEAINVKNGQAVKMGERIGTVGATGDATDCCLHFELKVNGQYVNPAYYIGEWQ